MLRTAKASARFEAPREGLYAIVSDYQRYRTWVPMISDSKLLTREGDVGIAEFRAPQWSDRSFTLEMVHTPPSSIAFQQIDSVGASPVSGHWRLEEEDGGVVVEASLSVATPLWHLRSRQRLRTELQLTLDALGARRRQSRAGRATESGARRKILEVIRQADGLKIWYLGETYLVPKVREPGTR